MPRLQPLLLTPATCSLLSLVTLSPASAAELNLQAMGSYASSRDQVSSVAQFWICGRAIGPIRPSAP